MLEELVGRKGDPVESMGSQRVRHNWVADTSLSLGASDSCLSLRKMDCNGLDLEKNTALT